MSLAPSIPFPVPGSIRCRSLSALFCLLWSFAFVAGKIGVTDCPPLILLTARFSLAGILILGISAIRGETWTMTWRDAAVFAVLGVANNALYLGLGYTGLQDGLRRPRRTDRQCQSGLHGGAGRAVPRRGADLAQGRGPLARHRRRRLHRLASHIGRFRQPARHLVHVGVAGLDRGRHHPVQIAGAEGKPVDRQRHPESGGRIGAVAVRLHALQTSATSCQARGCWARSPSWCSAARSSLISCGFIC